MTVQSHLHVPPIPALPPVGRATPAELRTAAEDALAAADNPYKLVARYRKARKCADALLDLGGDVASAEALGTDELRRALVAKVAGVNLPSEVTWALVVELVRERRGSG